MSERNIMNESDSMDVSIQKQNSSTSRKMKSIIQIKPNKNNAENILVNSITNGASFADRDLEFNIKDNERGISPNNFGYQTHGTSFSAVDSKKKEALISPELEIPLSILQKIDKEDDLREAFKIYQPKNKDIDMVSLQKSERCKVKKYKGCCYYGEFINGKRHGKGIAIYSPIRLFEGEWESDVKHGKGVEILSNGSRYDGVYVNGKPDGFGIFKWANGEAYEGEWKGGLKHGSGMWSGVKGESYFGEWKNGKAEGYGVHTWRNGDKYEGEFKAFLKHGRGTEKFNNGDYYVGNYTNGKPDGYGEYFWKNGCQYKGNFTNGLRHGKGVWKKDVKDCDVYDGEWVNDKKCGFGKYKWISGNYYNGNYFDDIRHGYGEMYWTDGSIYRGLWERGIQHGEGELIIPGKGVKKGLFQNNTFIDEAADAQKSRYRDINNRPSRGSTPLSSNFIKAFPGGRTSKPSDILIAHNSSFDHSLPAINMIDDVKRNTSSSVKGKNRTSSCKAAQKTPNNAGLLNKKEANQWNSYQAMLKQLPKKLQDLDNPEVCHQIRKIINPIRKMSVEKS